MKLTWLQQSVPSYSFEYESDRSNHMVTVTNIYYSALIQNFSTEKKTATTPQAAAHNKNISEAD